MRFCKKCKNRLDESSFELGRNSSKRSVCSSCHSKQRSPASIAKKLKRDSQRRKLTRLLDPAKAILEDSKKTDRKFGRVNDLNIDFIRIAISRPCEYCEGSNLRMTLDRMNNELGHIKSNVIPACIRCNYARGSMPFEAWEFLIPGMRQAQKANAFGNWIGRLPSMNPNHPVMDTVCKTVELSSNLEVIATLASEHGGDKAKEVVRRLAQELRKRQTHKSEGGD